MSISWILSEELELDVPREVEGILGSSEIRIYFKVFTYRLKRYTLAVGVDFDVYIFWNLVS